MRGASILLSIVLTGAIPSQGRDVVAVDLRGANLTAADLRGANLAGADLTGASLMRAEVAGAEFWRTRVDGADLRGVRGLTRQQLSSAIWDAERPPHLDLQLATFIKLWSRGRMQTLSLSKANWWGADLEDFNFTESNLRGVVFLDANLRGAGLQRADLTGALLAGADISGADFRGARGLTGAQLVAARWSPEKPPLLDARLHLLRRLWEKKRLSGESLAGARLWGKDLRGVLLRDANLRGVSLIGADLTGAYLLGADLTGAVWTGADISGADLRGCKGLSFARLVSATWRADRPPLLDDAQNVFRVKIEKQRMPGANLSGANLWGRDLRGWRLEDSSLRNATLIDADLRGTNLVQADLTGANLARANISGADLRNAKGLTVSRLLSARWREDDPPHVALTLRPFVRMWEFKDVRVWNVGAVNVWRGAVDGARLQGSDFSGATFLGAELRDVNFSLADLSGAVLVSCDISGADFRGARGFEIRSLLGSHWDRERPPILDEGMNIVRRQIEKGVFDFDLRGGLLQKRDSEEAVGPARAGDEVASWVRSSPPHFGLARLVELLRQRKHGRLRIVQ